MIDEKVIGLKKEIVSEINDKTKFEIVDKIAEGGMGVVYKAIKNDKVYAIKLIKQDDIRMADFSAGRRFRDEIESTENVHSLKDKIDKKWAPFMDNIVKIHDSYLHHAFPTDFPFFYVMDYLPNEINKKHKLGEISIEQAIKVVHDTCGGLHILHHELPTPIIHRDIKLENIMGTLDLPIITDFGLAKNFDKTDQTNTQQAVGSPRHMSPEQARGKPSTKELEKFGPDYQYLDSRSDIFSLGVVLYHLVTRRWPTYRENVGSMLSAIGDNSLEVVWPYTLKDLCANDYLLKKELKPGETLFDARVVDKRLGNIILTALAKNKDERYERVDDFMRDLDAYLDNRKPHAKVSFKRRAKRQLWTKNDAVRLRTLSGIGIVGLSALLGAYSLGKDNPGETALKSGETTFKKIEEFRESNNFNKLVIADKKLNKLERTINEDIKSYPNHKASFEDLSSDIKSLDETFDGKILEAAIEKKDYAQTLEKLLSHKVLRNLCTPISIETDSGFVEGERKIPFGSLADYSLDESNWKFSKGDRWTSGYWPHMLTLGYEITGNKKFLDDAIKYSEPLKKIVDYSKEAYNAKVVFHSLFQLYKHTDKKEFLDLSKRTADNYLSKFNEKGKFVFQFADNPNLMSIDVIENNDLLWAMFEETGDRKYFDVASAISTTVLDNFIKKDGSSFWRMKFNGSGFDASKDEYSKHNLTWATGHARALEHLVNYVSKTGDVSAMKKIEKAADYLLSKSGKDINFYINDSKCSDASATVSAAYALKKLSMFEKILGNKDKSNRYEKASKKFMNYALNNNVSSSLDDQVILQGCCSGPALNWQKLGLVVGDYYLLEGLNLLNKKSEFETKELIVDNSRSHNLRGWFGGFMKKNSGFVNPNINAKAIYDSVKKELELDFRVDSTYSSRFKDHDDPIWMDNSFSVVLGSEKGSYKLFSSNPSGVKYDAVGDDESKNPNFKVRNHEKDGKWYCSMRIPYDGESGINMIANLNGERYAWNHLDYVTIGGVNEVKFLSQNLARLKLK